MSLNKVILIGNTGKDPDIRHFEGGNTIANIVLATNERGYKLQNGTEVPERTEWHNIVARRDQATFVEKYVKKGSSLYVEGKIRTRDYEKDGIKRYITEIIADKVEFFGAKRASDGNTTQENPAMAMAAATATATTATAAEPAYPVSAEPFAETESGAENDLPF